MTDVTTTPAYPTYVEAYRQALEASHAAESPDRLLALLLARDLVHGHLKDGEKDALAAIGRIAELDRELYRLVSRSPLRSQLPSWRATAARGPDSWWWYLDHEQVQAQRDDQNWLWSALALVVLAIGLAFFIDTSRRFMSAGPDIISSFSVAFQLLLAVGVAGGVLTRSGQAMFARLFSRWPPFRWAQVRLLLAAGLLLVILAFRITLPGFAVYFNNQGRENQRLGAFHTAQRDYERAIQLQPEMYEAHYNLALLHEEMLDFDAAVEEYQYAWKGGLDVAYNNAARLQILMGRPAEAVSLLQDGLRSSADDKVSARLLKNLGWAWVELGAYADALAALQQALVLEDEMAAAHCLSAIALDGLERKDEAVIEWNECIRLAGNAVPEEIRWRLLAQEKVRQADLGAKNAP